MASPLPTLQYLVAFQNNAFDDPALITSVASPGVLGANNVWTDITSYVQSHVFDRGRQHELSQFEAGSCSLVLNNRDGRFSPYNTSSPYNGFLTVRKLFQLRQTWSGTTYTRFTGHVDSWPTDWPDQTSQWCSLHVSDAFRALNLADITSGGYVTAVTADTPSAYWRLGDKVGSNTAADSSGNGNTGTTVTGSPFPVFGQAGGLLSDTGNSALFTAAGSNDGIVSIANDIVTSGNTAMTGEFWFNGNNSSTSIDSTGLQSFFHLGATQYAMDLTVIGPGSPSVNCNCGTTTLTSATNLWDGKWHHLVGTMSTSTGMNLYIDGVLKATTATLPASAGAGTSFIFSGAETPGALLQEVAIYPTALSSARVTAHFQAAAWPQESTDARIGRVLTAISWSSGARALDAGKSTVQQQTTSLTTTSSLSHMQQVEGTEGGALFMTGDGKVKFLARSTLQGNTLYTTSQQKIGDNTAGGDMPFQPSPQLAIDDIDLYNEALATRTGGLPQLTQNSTSITNNGRVTWNPPATLIGISDPEVLALTQYIVSKFATPVVRIQSVTVDLLELITPNIVANLLSLDLLYQITVERTVTPDGGTAFSQTANIERIHETVTPDSWQVTFQLAKADPAWWVLGTSQLGTTTELAW